MNQNEYRINYAGLHDNLVDLEVMESGTARIIGITEACQAVLHAVSLRVDDCSGKATFQRVRWA